MPAGLRVPILGLDLYQWIGLGVILSTSILLGWGLLKLTNVLLARLLQMTHLELSSEFVMRKIVPLSFQVVLWGFHFQVPWLDLPIALVGYALPTFKFLWVCLLAWSVFRLIDLGMAMYTNSEHLKVRNNLSDMFVPMATRVLKLVVFLMGWCTRYTCWGIPSR